MATILIVDDNPDILKLLSMILQQQGHLVISGRNGAEGMALLEESQPKPELIISNYFMPVVNGMKFLSRVRAHSDYKHIPFVMLSAAPGTAWQQEAAELGANGFIPKPFRLESLRQAVRLAMPSLP